MFFTGGGWQGLHTTKRCFLRETALMALKAMTSTVNSPSLGGVKHRHGDTESTQASGPSSSHPAGLCSHSQEATRGPSIGGCPPSTGRDRHRTQTDGTCCVRSQHPQRTCCLPPRSPTHSTARPSVVATQTRDWGPLDLHVLFPVLEVADPTAWRRGWPAGLGGVEGPSWGER